MAVRDASEALEWFHAGAAYRPDDGTALYECLLQRAVASGSSEPEGKWVLATEMLRAYPCILATSRMYVHAAGACWRVLGRVGACWGGAAAPMR